MFKRNGNSQNDKLEIKARDNKKHSKHVQNMNLVFDYMENFIVINFETI